MPHRLDITAGGIRLAGYVRGAQDAPSMVLLHALGGRASDWDGVARPLAERFRVFAFDLRGHGDSDWPGTYSFELMRDDVLSALDQLGLGQVILVGHSMGGTVAYLIAGHHPARRPPAQPRPVPERDGDEPMPLDWAVIPALITQLNEPDPAWWDRATGITAPTLLIGGGPGSHTVQSDLAELAARMPDGRLATIPAGHHVHSDQPAEFTAAVLAFLRP